MYVDSIKENGLIQRINDPTSPDEMAAVKMELKAFQQEMHPGMKIVGDNADMINKARQLSKDHRNKDHHFFNHSAIKNRISSNHLPNKTAINATGIQPIHLLPSVEDNSALREDLIVLTANVIASYLPSLAWFSTHVPNNISHEYDKVASSKSEVVNLGVLLHNENTTEGVTAIMDDLHQYVPGVAEDGEHLIPIISGGDLLTAERESNVQEDRRDTPEKRRWGGLIPNIEDFHTTANAYQAGWKLFYSTDSARDIGTMYPARNYLGLTNVTTDPFKNFHAATELVVRWTDSLIVCAALTYFGMDELEDAPSLHKYDLSKECPKDYVYRVCGKLLDDFAMVSGPTPETPGLVCPFCARTFKKMKGLRKHIAEKHKRQGGSGVPHQSEPAASTSATSASTCEEEDGIFNYSCAALGYFLLIRDFQDAIRLADGKRIMRIYKFLMLYFKATGKHKYAFHSLRLLLQVHHLLPPRIAHQLTWNRFVNMSGLCDSNFPMDLFLEFMNKIFKLDCRGFHGKITEDAVKRVSRAAQKLDEILQSSDKAGSVKPRSGKHKKRDVKQDVIDLIKIQHEEHIFENRPGRHHNAFPGFPRHPLLQLDFSDLHSWMTKKIKDVSKEKIFQKYMPIYS